MLLRPILFLVICCGAVALRAQSGVPTLSQAFPAREVAPGGTVTIDVRAHLTMPGVVGTDFAQFNTVFGRFNVELRGDVAPRHVVNFLNYARSGAYANTFIHRAASFDNGSVSIVQGGGYGYRLPFQVTEVPRGSPVSLEYNLPNARGTLAAARTNDINSATSEWYFNVRDNSTILNQANNGGYTVFGRVLGNGLTVLDAMAALPRFNAGSPFNEIPLRNYTSGNATEAHLVVITSVTPVSLFPTGSGASIVALEVQSSAPGSITATLNGSQLELRAVGSGSAVITVRATDTHGSSAEGTFNATVGGVPPAIPVFTAQPLAHTAAAGSTVVFNAAATGATSYRWERDGNVIPGATSSMLVLPNVSAANVGRYVSFATNALGTVPSEGATLSVATAGPAERGRLVNLSILTLAGTGARVLTMGAVVGPFNATEGLPLVMRAVGPTLGQPPFNVAGALADPVMTFFAAGNPTPIDSNDNWGGSAALSAAFAAVGAFALPPASLDGAIVRPAPGVAPGGYTVQVSGKGTASGLVIAEIYDATTGARTATTPRLINLSTLAQIDAGSDLAVGFVIGGQTAQTVLVRGVGPSLSRFNVDGLMTDPRIELFAGSTRIAVNDDWAGEAEIANYSSGVGAFPLVAGNSKDAVILVTLPPGPYSARVSGVGSTGGSAIVEVYEVP